MKIREAAVAGTFYESDPVRLQQVLVSLLDGGDTPAGPRPKVLIVPHAGYIYSGALAARAYRSLVPFARDISRVVLFGPAHRVPLRGMALPDAEAFNTPLGTIPLDCDTVRSVSGLPEVVISSEAHRLEHSLEVQLPFLQTVLGSFSLVPIVVGDCDKEAAAAVIDTLWGGVETLVVISTDLSHFHQYDEAKRLDERTCGRVLARDASLNGRDACGAYALNGLLCSENARALSVITVGLCNSGDTAGSRDRVVGYGAFMLY